MIFRALGSGGSIFHSFGLLLYSVSQGPFFLLDNGKTFFYDEAVMGDLKQKIEINQALLFIFPPFPLYRDRL